MIEDRCVFNGLGTTLCVIYVGENLPRPGAIVRLASDLVF